MLPRKVVVTPMANKVFSVSSQSQVNKIVEAKKNSRSGNSRSEEEYPNLDTTL